jgi:hypothetical protein
LSCGPSFTLHRGRTTVYKKIAEGYVALAQARHSLPHRLVGWPMPVLYTDGVTRALNAAIEKLAALPADEQDLVARWLMEELKDEEHWAEQWAGSQDALAKLADEAVAEVAAGRAADLDPDKL